MSANCSKPEARGREAGVAGFVTVAYEADGYGEPERRGCAGNVNAPAEARRWTGRDRSQPHSSRRAGVGNPGFGVLCGYLLAAEEYSLRRLNRV